MYSLNLHSSLNSEYLGTCTCQVLDTIKLGYTYATYGLVVSWILWQIPGTSADPVATHNTAMVLISGG